MKKILITGAAGGIGSSLVKDLTKENYELILVDNLHNGYLDNIEESGIDLSSFFQFCINSEEFEEKIKEKKPDIIIHLAAITALPECELNYKECLRVNVEGTANVLSLAAKYGVKRVIFTSTSAVYENNTTLNGFRESESINPRLYYSLSKKFGEELCETYKKNYGLDVVVLRLFNVFGPNQDIKRKSPPLINYINREFLEGRMPLLHSDGLQSRDYVYIQDVLNVIKYFFELENNYQDNYIFNVCSNVKISLKEIVEYIKNSNSNFKKLEVNYREPERLWDNYPELFTGVYPLKREIVEKETNKTSIGNNSLLKEVFDYEIDKNIENRIQLTSKEIQKKYKINK